MCGCKGASEATLATCRPRRSFSLTEILVENSWDGDLPAGEFVGISPKPVAKRRDRGQEHGDGRRFRSSGAISIPKRHRRSVASLFASDQIACAGGIDQVQQSSNQRGDSSRTSLGCRLPITVPRRPTSNVRINAGQCETSFTGDCPFRESRLD